MSDEAIAAMLSPLTDLWQETLQWQPDAAQQAKFQQLYELIVAGNRQFNLTRITEPTEFWEKHLWDSLAGIKQSLISPSTPDSPSPFKAIDIGTGAGFPGIPIAIARPDWTVTLLDSTRKKVAFLEGLLNTLGLENINTWCDRAEQIGHDRQHRASYDLALLRAVAPASVCAEYALPLLKVDGLAVLYRGQWTEAEAAELPLAVEQLGGTVESIEAFSTPLTQSVRHCLYLRKIAPTVKEFPRAVGIPTQKPL